MRRDLTDITILVDRSGSMSSCKSDAEGGLREFVDQQRKAVGEAVLTLAQFDHEYQVVQRAIDVRHPFSYNLIPRGNTALLDAMGRAITETGERLSNVPDFARPGLVIFVG